MPKCVGIVPISMEGKPIRTACVYGIGISSGLYKKIKFLGRILLDGNQVNCMVTVHAGQKIELIWEEKEFPKPERSQKMLRVAYEDEHFLIVDKPAPLPTSPSMHQSGETLENIVFTYLGEPRDFVYRPVNRLDKGTSGLLVIAKNARAQERAAKLLHTDDFVREYLAVVEGVPKAIEGIISARIAKEDAASIKRVVCEDGKEAVTEYRVIRSDGKRSLVRLRLQTGRTHQIRVHLASIGCPVCGDFLYGTEMEELPGRFALHSAYLKVKHPMSGEIVECEAELPQELERLVPSDEDV